MDITQVPAGYKLTELGVLPEDWKVKTLREVLKGARLGGNYANSEAYSPKPLIKMGNMKRGSISLHKVEYITGQQSKVDSKHRLVYGDLLFNTRNTIDLVGKISIWRDELPVAYYNSNILRFDFDPTQIASSFFVNHIVNTEDAVNRMRGLATGTTSVAAIYTRDLLNFQIPIPPLDEQQAIAAALDDMDALLAAQRARLAKQRAVKQGLLQGLLSGKQRLPEFAGEWEMKQLGDVATVMTGNTPPTSDRSNYGNEFLFASPADLGTTKYITNTEKKLSSKGFSIARKFPAGSTLFTCIGSTIGKTGLSISEITSNQQINACFPKEGFLPEYLYYILTFLAPIIKSTASEQAVPLINKTDFSKTIIPVPSIDEQRAIAAVLSEADAYLAALEAEHAKTQLLKQGMMQNLLTGKLRLV